MADSTQKATEPSDPISFFSYRGHISRPIFFLCLLIELVLLFLGVIVLAAAMNSTGSGGGVGLLYVMFAVVAWFHSVAAIKRLRDAGRSIFAYVICAGWPAVVLAALAASMMGAIGNSRMTEYEDLFRIGTVITGLIWLLPGVLPPASDKGDST